MSLMAEDAREPVKTMTIERIWLTGFMGTGKSRIARPLAAALDWTSIDLDAMIEREAQDSITHIFKSGGEGAFRALESQAVDNASRMAHVVVATGGGAVLLEANRALMKKDALIVCLDASPDTILRRLQESGPLSDRPLLAGDDPLPKIRELKATRDALYRDADVVVNTDDMTPDEVTHQIILAYRERTALAGSAP